MELFTFPPAPDEQVPEWPGDPIGASNTITRTKTRTAVNDKTIDRLEGRADPVAQGKQTFRYETFGDETKWTDTLHLDQVIDTVDPTTALSVDSPAGGVQATRDLLASGFAPTAIVCVGEK